VPAKDVGAARSLIKQMAELVGENLKGVRLERGDETDLVVFRVGSGTQTIREGEWSTDGASLVITHKRNNLEVFAVHNARSLRRGSQILFSSKTPTTIAANFKADEIAVVCNVESEFAITLFVAKKPVRVLLDGQELKPSAFTFKVADGTISVSMPPGQHDVKIIFH
jgi:hypothetical protein